ncbi:hypothetical protein AB0C81_12030 [Streptomyces roseoverticillatus]
MLSAESASVIRATPPAVGGALDEVTTRFYATMFAEQPALLDGMFNRGNQASGAQRRAPAGAVAAFAGALAADPGARPDTLLARIAHKHVAVGVTDDQYTIVSGGRAPRHRLLPPAAGRRRPGAAGPRGAVRTPACGSRCPMAFCTALCRRVTNFRHHPARRPLPRRSRAAQ